MPSVTVVSAGSLFEGRIVSDGEVIVEAGAEVRAEIRARRVVVRGIVRGDVIAPEVRLEDGGKVFGGLRTPAAEAAVQVAAAASRPGSRNQLAPAMADELALGVALDAAREITSEIEGAAGAHAPDAKAASEAGAPARRVVAVRRKG